MARAVNLSVKQDKFDYHARRLDESAIAFLRLKIQLPLLAPATLGAPRRQKPDMQRTRTADIQSVAGTTENGRI